MIKSKDVIGSKEASKELMIVKGAGHGKSREADPLAYWEKVDTFLEKYI